MSYYLRRYWKIILFTISPFFIFVFFPYHNLNASDLSYLNHLLETANQKKLHEDRYWSILLHYKKSIFGIKSLIDDPNFFLAPDGKINPKSELEECIRSFFSGTLKESDPLICKFIARYTWLKEELAVDPKKVPVFECKKINKVNAKSASLSFPTYYMNNPASMFGHTLIIIETEYPNKLLYHAVNYSAFTEETNGFLFAFKGIFGFYDGFYSILPYYTKIQEYSDINQRDIWEYKLNLTESELNKMVLHIRELEKISAKYFFFDENCSYNLLFLLEAGRPTVNLTDQFGQFVAPIDTVKAIKKAGLIEKSVYRPSKATKINQKYKLLTKKFKYTAQKIIDGQQKPDHILTMDIDDEKKIIITDYIVDYLQFLFVKRKLSKCEYQKILFQTLKVRSKLGKARDDLYKIKKPNSPENVHSTRRMSIGSGVRGDKTFYEFSYRFAFSDLIDTDYDDSHGIQIELGNIKFRYDYREDQFELKSFTIADIISITPYDHPFGSFSWKVNFGLSQKMTSEKNESLMWKIATGAGLAFYRPFPGLFYTFLETELDVSGILKDNYSLGGGISAGLIKKITPWWKFHSFAKNMYFEFGERYQETSLTLLQNFRISQNNQINIELSGIDRFSEFENIAKIYWYYFF
ncbi:conserved hypothetical protein, secreted [Candidatus Magnetomorum sp. HK-1]|nr:conserved hypothetical protein, secreted [Candidatus Magnetomorum sp. HK-1]